MPEGPSRPIQHDSIGHDWMPFLFNYPTKTRSGGVPCTTGAAWASKAPHPIALGKGWAQHANLQENLGQGDKCHPKALVDVWLLYSLAVQVGKCLRTPALNSTEIHCPEDGNALVHCNIEFSCSLHFGQTAVPRHSQDLQSSVWDLHSLLQDFCVSWQLPLRHVSGLSESDRECRLLLFHSMSIGLS